jgi:polysaccharide biosynthesis/export protein
MLGGLVDGTMCGGRWKTDRWWRGCPILCILVLLSCGARQPFPPRDVDVKSLMSARDRARLADLTAERIAHESGRAQDYRIGPDDLLEVSIPDLLSGTAFQAVAPAAPLSPAVPKVEAAPTFREGMRVSALGDITIPQIGVVPAAGRTVRRLEQEIARRLQAAGILQHPEVRVAIVEYRSRVVAVVGSVERPGLYPLTRSGATIADLIWAAGGPAHDAGRLVQFAAAQPGAEVQNVGTGLTFNTQPLLHVAAYTQRVDGTDGVADRRVKIAAAAAKDTADVATDHAGVDAAQLGQSSIRIDLEALLSPTADDDVVLNVPVRPGDVISIAPGGVVLVDGWVSRPGAYPITRSLTVAGAIAAAGGKMFPADLPEATMRRVLRPGEERLYQIDLEAVAEGRANDVALLDGDVIYLPASTWRLVPWGLWTLINSMLHFGAAVPL